MSCLICERIKMIKDKNNPYFVKELQTGYVVIGDHQRFKGYTLFLCKKHVRELHDLDNDYMMKHLEEMAFVSKACAHAFTADKMNIESLGNGDAHLHFHIFPRKDGDTPVKGPVWWLPKEEMYHDSQRVKGSTLKEYKAKLLASLESLGKLF